LNLSAMRPACALPVRRLTAAVLLVFALGSAAARADSLGDVRTGNAAFGNGRYEAAVDAFSRAILAGDLNHEALAITFNNRGVAYSELGDYDRAIGDYGQALALVPGDATAIRNLRIAYIRRAAASARLGDRDAAVADYDRAIAIEPSHPLAYLRRGQLALERGDRTAAISDLTRARDLDPQNTDIAALLAAAERMPESTAAAEPAAVEAPSTAPAPTTVEPPLQAVEPAAEPPAQVATPAPPAAPPSDSDYSIDPPEGAPPPASTAGGSGTTVAVGGPGRPYQVLADVNVRQGPGNDYARVATLAEGSTAMVTGERLGWFEVRLETGSGWVYGKWLRDLGGAGVAQPE
jgi:tetratricopeptide (TPR) repeat protein